MSQFETEYSATSHVGTKRRKWPLAAVVWIDLAITTLVVITLTSLLQILFIGLSARAQGLDLANLGGLSQEEVIRLIGARGIFVSVLVQNAICVVVPLVRVGLIRRESLEIIGLHIKRLFFLLATGVSIGITTLVMNIALSAMFAAFGIRSDQSQQFSLFLTRGDVLGQILFFVATALLAPIGEEFLFRGYLFNALRQGSEHAQWRLPIAYVVSAAIFSAVHLATVSEGQIALLVPIFVLGLLLAMSVHLTGSIVPAIIAHAMNNSIGVSALLVCVNNPGFCPAV
jgi:hypothetical protein